MKTRSLAEWTKRANDELLRVLEAAESVPALSARGLGDATVTLLGEKAMRDLNRTYRKKDKATDVLSFGTTKAFRSLGMLGELVVCLPVLKKQANALGHSADAELTILLIHGLLHLLGFDHEKSASAARTMAAHEKNLLSKLSLKRESLIERSRSCND